MKANSEKLITMSVYAGAILHRMGLAYSDGGSMTTCVSLGWRCHTNV
jgi:hypothetical protein